MKTLRLKISAVLFGLGLVSLGATSASARIACNEEGDCWHTTTVYEYPSEAHIVVHEDNWKWGDKDHFAWREHEGRGFWRNHAWTNF